VVQERQRKHDGLPYSKGVALEGDERAQNVKGGLEGDKMTGHLKGGGSSRAEPRGSGGSLAKERLLSRKSGSRIKLEYLP